VAPAMQQHPHMEDRAKVRQHSPKRQNNGPCVERVIGVNVQGLVAVTDAPLRYRFAKTLLTADR